MKDQPKNLYLAVAATAVVMGGVGFFGGIKYQQAKQAGLALGNGQGYMMGQGLTQQRGERGFGTGNNNGQNQTGTRQAGMMNRPVVGEIIKQDDKSITVKAQDGSSKIIILSDTTKINKASEATVSDLKVGETVNIFGTSNSDGSVTAQNVQLSPLLRQQTNQEPPQQ